MTNCKIVTTIHLEHDDQKNRVRKLYACKILINDKIKKKIIRCCKTKTHKKYSLRPCFKALFANDF